MQGSPGTPGRRYLIVLCSPNAAQSRWVNEEVRYFKSLGREDRILAIILAGEPNASDDSAQADQECCPPALRYRIDDEGKLTDQRTEPIGGDLRRGGDGWTQVFLKAVAGVTGLTFVDSSNVTMPDNLFRNDSENGDCSSGLGIDVFLTLVSAITDGDACAITTEWD